MSSMKNPIKGWQPISSAVKRIGISRQRIHQLISTKIIPFRLVFGAKWVPDPLKYKPDLARRDRAINSRK